jgi:hypothetical protein
MECWRVESIEGCWPLCVSHLLPERKRPMKAANPVVRAAFARAVRHSSTLRRARRLCRWVRTPSALNELYQALIHEALPTDAPEPWRAAMTEGGSELGELQRGMPRLSVSTIPSTTTIEQIVIDGRPVVRSFQRIRLDPGVHEVIVSAAGIDRRQHVDLGQGEHRELVFDLSAATAPSGTGTQPAVAKAEALGPATSTPHRGWVWAAFGVAAASVAIGATSGVIAISGTRKLDQPCNDGGPCSEAEFERDKATAQRWALTATLATVIGGIAAGAGASLLLLESSRAESRSLRVTLTPNQLLLNGAF